MEARLIKYKVKPGKEGVLKKWMQFINENRNEESLAIQRGQTLLQTAFLLQEEDKTYFLHYMIANSIKYATEKFIERNDNTALRQWDFFQECLELDPEPEILKEQYLFINNLYF